MIQENFLKIYKLNDLDSIKLINILLKIIKKYNIKTNIQKNLYLNLSKYNNIPYLNSIRILVSDIVLRESDNSLFFKVNSVLDENSGIFYDKNKYYISVSNLDDTLDLNNSDLVINLYEEKLTITKNGIWLDMTICK